MIKELSNKKINICFEIKNELAKYESEVAPLFERIRKADRDFILTIDEEETYEELWKRNLFEISKCRSLIDIKNSNNIDDVFKAFMAKDTIGLAGSYFIVCDKRGNEDFVLSDCFPMVHEGFMDSGISLTLYLFIPVSPGRILIQAFDGCENTPNSLSLIDKKILVYPSLSKNNFKYSIKKIYEEYIHRINEVTIKNSSYGYIKGEN